MGQRVPPISKQLLCQLECIGETQVVAVKRRSEQIQLGCQGRSEPPPYGAVRGNSATKPGQDRTGQDRTGQLTDYDDSEATSIIAGQNSIRL